LTLTCASKEAFNCAPWLSNGLGTKCNIPEAVEKGDDHAFLYIGHFFSRGFGVFFPFFFDQECEYPDQLTIGNL